MTIVLLCYGSRGDVQPYLTLARALRHIGRHVRLVAPPNFADLIGEYSVEFQPVGVDLQAHLASRVKALAAEGRTISNLRHLRDELSGIMDDVARDTWQASQGAELVIGVGPSSASVAEKLGVPFIEVALQPVTPTRAFASPVAPAWLKLGGAVNRLTHLAFEEIFWQVFRGTTNRMRTRTLGLPPLPLTGPMRQIREQGRLRLYAYSPLVEPRPDDWPAHHHVTGYWFLPPPPGWQPPEQLLAFLEAGPPPVYVGFGSMLDRDSQTTTALVIEALARTGQRAVLAGGWGALDGRAKASAHIFFAESIPHHWLFPRMAAIVHHGGAGTTGAALRSGVPSVVVPYGFDQLYWGGRVAALGAGPPPIPRPRLTAARLAGALEHALGDARLRERAAQLGEAIRAEQGTARAIDHIHSAVALARPA